MSRCNSRSAKAARRVQREAPGGSGKISRARIAQAVHEAVCEVTGTDGYGHCVMYAQAGALTASVLTGRDYVLQAGAAVVFTGDVNGYGELALHVDPAGSEWNGQRGGRENNELHCWLTRRPAEVPGSAVPATPGDEVADFSLRHWRWAVAEAGMPWSREPLPAFWWGPLSGLNDLRVRYTADADTMRLVYGELLPAMDAAPYDASVIALRLLGAISEETTMRKMSPAAASRRVMRTSGWQLAEVVPGGGAVFTRPGRS